MLDWPSNQIDDIRQQSFSVTYDYSVVFTREAADIAREISFCVKELAG